MGRLSSLRLPLILTAIILALLPRTVDCARNWASVAADVEHSLVIVTHHEVILNPYTGESHKVLGTCTGFSVNREHSYFMTAYHCLNEGTAADLTIDGQHARLLYANKTLDLAVITADVHKPALHASTKALRKGDQIATLGHAYGFIDTLFRAGYVANPNIDLDSAFGPGYDGQWLIFDSAYIGGMSGGPVFALDGQVVGIVQQADDTSGFGLNIKTILEATGFYWK